MSHGCLLRKPIPSLGMRVSIAGLACLAACAPPGPGTRILSSTAPRLREQVWHVEWRVQVRPDVTEEPPVRAQLWRWRPEETAVPLVVEPEHEIVVGSTSGVLRAYDLEGRPRWRYAAGGPIEQQPAYARDEIFVASADGSVHALVARTGHELWSRVIGEQPATPPVVSGGIVYLATHQTSVFALDAGTGASRWHYRREQEREFTLRTVAAPVPSGGFVYTGFSDGTTVALRADTGEVVWQRASGPGDQFIDAGATPQLAGGRVYVATYRDGVFALDAKSGDLVWRKPMPGATGLLLRDGLLFVGAVGKVVALAPGDGSLLWERGLGDRSPGPLRLTGTILVVPASDALVFLNDRTGERLGEGFNPGRGVDAPAAIEGRNLYVLSNAGWLYALSL